MLALTPWPELSGLQDASAEAEIGWLIDLITAIRSIRAEMNINVNVPIILASSSAITLQRVLRWGEFIKRLARVSDISMYGFEPKNIFERVLRDFYNSWWRPYGFWRWQKFEIPNLRGAVQLVVRDQLVFLPIAGLIDLAAERARLLKEMQKAEADIARVDGKLGNANFVARAPEEVVEEEKEKRAEAAARKAKIAEALERLKGAT